MHITHTEMSEYGVPLTHWRVYRVNLECSGRNRVAMVVLGGWPSEAAADSGAEPMMLRTMHLTGEDAEAMFEQIGVASGLDSMLDLACCAFGWTE